MKKIRTIFKIFCIVIVFALICFFAYIKQLPVLEIRNTNNVVLYDSFGNDFFEGSQSNSWVKLSEISKDLINATISTEDKSFYKHNGFDFLRIGKALYTNIKSGSNKQGASTISQQYAKNLFLNFDKTWKRKINEAWYTIRIESNYTKDEILEGYLNTINYGHGQYGIKNASKYYFNKLPIELSLAEASLLTGIPKAPSNYSPFINYDLSKARQKAVLNMMVKNNIISDSEANSAYNEELIFSKSDDVETYNSLSYYEDAVFDELNKINNLPKSFDKVKELNIYTEINLDSQKKLDSIIKETFPENSEIQTAVVMIDPNTGGIVSLVGGRDYLKSSYNRATSSKRQVGSTMKPFLYYAALENGFTTSSCFTSEKTSFNIDTKNSYSPSNYNEIYGNKPISMATAVAYSDNIYAVKTHMFLGGDTLINVAKRVGITSTLENIPSLPLGTNEINIIEMAAGYSSFANEGYKISPHFIKKITDSDGKILYENPIYKDPVLNSSITFILNNMLTSTYDSDYIDYNYPTAISLAPKLKHKYALKSGTTNTDNWDIGYNKDIVCAVWVGYDNNKELDKSEYKYAQNIWYKTIENYEAEKKFDEGWYEKPKNISIVLVDPISGKPVDENSEKKKFMYFIKGTEPGESKQVFDEVEDLYSLQ